MVSLRRKKVMQILILHHLISKSQTRRFWIHPLNQRRDQNGEHLKIEAMYEKYPERFFQYIRMSPQLFDKLLSTVGPHLRKQDTTYREAVTIRIRLFVILRYLATGDSLHTIATNFSLGQSTVWSIIRSGLPVFWEKLRFKYVKVPTSEEWNLIADDFWHKWNYPNCLGALDGKHVVITAPPRSGSLYLNYKGTFSIVLLATCDANYKFTTVDVGGYGKQSDGGVFIGSKLGKKLCSGSLEIPSPKPLHNTSTKVPFHFVADEAFPLSMYMMRPYPGSSLSSNQKRIFNYRLSRARRCIENAFGIMAARFKIFRRPIPAEPKHVEHIVLAAVALHNFIMTEERSMQPTDRQYCPPGFADTDDHDNGSWRNENTSGLFNTTSRLSMAAQERLSKKMREDLTCYFSSEGQVEWQNERAGITVDG